MKIVLLGTAWPYRGGLAAYNERLARQFQREGHEVEILTFTLQYPNFLFPGKTQYSDAPAPKDLLIRRVLNSINPFNWLRVGRMVRRMKADRLVIKFWIPLMAPCLGTVARIAKRSGVQVVSILDNVIPHEPKPWDKWLIRYFVRSVDRFVAMSQSVLDDCTRFDTVKPKVLTPHPLYDNFGESLPREEALRVLGLKPNMIYLLFFGFIRDYKGLDLLMRALALLKQRGDYSRVKLIVAGEFYNNGEQYAELEKQLHLEGEIIWRTQFIADDEVRNYFSACDMVVQPYKSATQSGVTQIAYHFLRPMLVTDVGGLAEIVPNGKVGYVCKVDECSIADALQDFCDNPKQERFANHLLHEREKYSWTRMVEAILGQKE